MRQVETTFNKHLDPSVASAIVEDGRDELNALHGVDYSFERRVPAQSGFSASSISFNYVGGEDILISRWIGIQHSVEYTITAAANNRTVDMASLNTVLACNPLMRICKSCNVSLNGTTKSVSPHEWCNALQRYDSKNDYCRMDSMAPKDSDAYSTAELMGIFGQTKYTAYSRAGSRANHKYEFKIHQTQTTGLPQIVKVTWTFVDRILNPWFDNGLDDNNYIANVRNLDIQLTLNNVLGTIVQGALPKDSGDVNCTVSTAFGSKTPELLIYTKKPSVNIPQIVPYDINNYQVYNFNVSGMNTLTSLDGSVTTGSISLSTVPDSIYMYCRQSADINTSVADGFGLINSVTIHTDDNVQLQNANPEMLYGIASRNGVSSTYSEFTDYHGSVLKINVPSDIGVQYIPGTKVNFRFDVTATLSNNTFKKAISNTFADKATTGTLADQIAVTSWKFYVVCVFPSKVYLDYNNNAMEVEGLSVEESMAMGGMEYSIGQIPQGSDVHAGGLFSFLKKGRKLLRPLSAVMSMVPDKRVQAFARGADVLSKLTGGTLSVAGGVHTAGAVNTGGAVNVGGNSYRARTRM